MPAPATGGEYRQQQGDASLHLDALIADDGRVPIHLSGAALTLRVRGTAPVTMTHDPRVVLSQGWTVLGRPAAKGAKAAGVAEESFRLEPPVKPGELLDLEVAPLTFQRRGEPPVTVRWKPIRVRILKPALSEMSENTGPEDVPEARSPYEVASWVLVALVVGAATLVCWKLASRRRRPAPATPGEWALRELARASAGDLTTSANVERVPLVLSDLVRRYLELQFRLPASHQTTDEFFDGIRDYSQLTADQRALLRVFLERCDLAKFARAIPSDDECRALAGMAKDFILSSQKGP